MWPACLTAAALMLACATTTGGVTAILLKKRMRSNTFQKAISLGSSSSKKEKAP